MLNNKQIKVLDSICLKEFNESQKSKGKDFNVSASVGNNKFLSDEQMIVEAELLFLEGLDK